MIFSESRGTLFQILPGRDIAAVAAQSGPAAAHLLF
jgi:hypothetical protein